MTPCACVTQTPDRLVRTDCGEVAVQCLICFGEVTVDVLRCRAAGVAA